MTGMRIVETLNEDQKMLVDTTQIKAREAAWKLLEPHDFRAYLKLCTHRDLQDEDRAGSDFPMGKDTRSARRENL